MNIIIVFGLFVCTAFKYAVGIRCYSCVFSQDVQSSMERCGDEFRYITLDALNCDGTCYKRRGFRQQNSNVRSLEISRGCHTQTTEYCHDDNGVEECFCNTDYCNTASTRVPRSAVITATVLSMFTFIVTRIS
ncbi:hypothetical protein ScPMuIL_010037 [Solemya velum]